MAHLARKNPASAATLDGVNADGFGNRADHTQIKARPQLHRHGDTSSMLAFIDAPDGSPMGWLAKGVRGWNAVRTGTGDGRSFSTALRPPAMLRGLSMILTSITIRRQFDGPFIGAIVKHVDGRVHVLAPDRHGNWSPGRGYLQHAIATVTAELNSTFYTPTPPAAVDPLAWLIGIAADRRLTGAGRHVAGIIAEGVLGDWQGLEHIGRRASMLKANAARSIKDLIVHTHVQKNRHRGRAFYTLTVPMGVQ